MTHSVEVRHAGTHAMFDAVLGPYTTSENALSADRLTRTTPGDAVLGRPRLLQLLHLDKRIGHRG